MARLIDADALNKALNDRVDAINENRRKGATLPNIAWFSGMACAESIVEAQPTVDAVPVRHGKWIKIHPQDIYECSECHQNVMTSDIECYKFCHHCGARMDEK